MGPKIKQLVRLTANHFTILLALYIHPYQIKEEPSAVLSCQRTRLLKIYFLLFHMSEICLHVWMHTVHAWGLRRSEEGTVSLGAGLIEGCEPSGGGFQSGSSRKAISGLNHGVTLPCPQECSSWIISAQVSILIHVTQKTQHAGPVSLL